jgi:hypothetical protein
LVVGFAATADGEIVLKRVGQEIPNGGSEKSDTVDFSWESQEPVN